MRAVDGSGAISAMSAFVGLSEPEPALYFSLKATDIRVSCFVFVVAGRDSYFARGVRARAKFGTGARDAEQSRPERSPSGCGGRPERGGRGGTTNVRAQEPEAPAESAMIAARWVAQCRAELQDICSWCEWFLCPRL